MGLIKDYKLRTEIDKEAKYLVSDSFTPLVLKKIQILIDKKAEKKIASKIAGLKSSARKYITENKLGVYGKARLLREMQSQLQQCDFNSELIEAILNDFLADPLKK